MGSPRDHPSRPVVLRTSTAERRAALLNLIRLSLSTCPSFRAVPEGEAGVRCVSWTDRHRAGELAEVPPGGVRPQTGSPLCVGCGLLIDGVNPCPHQLSTQDSVLLGAQKLGLALDAEVPNDEAPSLWTP